MNNVVDSSAWLEYFGGTENAANFMDAIQNTDWLIVPSVVVFEVYKKLLFSVGEEKALKGLMTMSQGQIIGLDQELAVTAAHLQKEHALPMADAIILATARFFNATLWTQDSDFIGIDGVEYFSKD
ncbi:type II toxin-antitoxin system VapC family toxin [Candidatus Peregrinibacteria bacterium]|jgi:toxin FitB|nr:type II toxin-antitoxin system VapC family toxin [Candidatus Peregrinibacteria bacterium]